ncbi:MAG: hypothetical protein ICV73_28980 [Acetobacteraceae bacterium]|nr:hypothetical protein [Acetobacteraceae bacterium]
MTPPELRALVLDALALWDVAAAVAVDGSGVALVAPDGMPLRIVPAAPDERPVRWWLERPGQRRPCTSVLGLLRTLRNAVGAGTAAESARRLRVVAPAGE